MVVIWRKEDSDMKTNFLCGMFIFCQPSLSFFR